MEAMMANRKKQKPKPKPKPTHNWFKWGGKVYCCPDVQNTCIVAKFAESKKLSRFHDEDLARCTKELNAVLAEIRKRAGDDHRELSFIDTGNGFLLAWTEHDVVGSHDDETDID